MAIELMSNLPSSASSVPATASSSSASSEPTLLNLTVVHRKQEHVLSSLPPTTTLSELRHAIEQLTFVPVDKQKLLVPRNAGIADLNRPPQGTALEEDDRTIEEVGLLSKNTDHVKLTLLGPSSQELEDLLAREDEMHKRNAPRQYHPSMLRGTKARNTTTPGSTISPFGTVQPHPATPPDSSLYTKAFDYLTRLSRDPGILHICQLNDFRVGVLTELLPWEHPGLLGLNENAGQKIYLRIRTDDAEGFRDYKTTRRVLVHELAHNKVADHPPEFKILNSKLNAQIETFERAQKEGTHQLVEGDFYQPPEPTTLMGSSQRLGTSSSHAATNVVGGHPTTGDAESIEQRRQRILLATMRRWEKEEQEIEESCGSNSTITSIQKTNNSN